MGGKKANGRGWKKVNYKKKPKGPSDAVPEYTDVVVDMNNEQFNKYYKAQKILSDDEFEQMLATLRVLLPISFRITGNRSHATDLRDLMINEYFPGMEDFVVDGEKIEVPKPVPWYPGNLGWESKLTRQSLRKVASLASFHRFLVAETEVGNFSRQEIVSMVPTLLLDVKSHHTVLDMCAAPGSKTAQLLEDLHANEAEAIPTGLVIANDADQKRCHLLVKQTKRLQSPCLIVTNHEAQQFPNIFFSELGEEQKALRFDRILADVPCSGDGTFRKNKLIWNTWRRDDGNGLHRIQIPILRRGAALLKVGGRIVYSTCSFNPIENEAVVAAAIAECRGALRLVDVSAELPALIRKPGLSTWTFQHKNGFFYNSFDETPEDDRKGVLPSMFPPANASELNLDRCIRIYPHLQNTGGFFVAVLEKVAAYGSLDKPRSEPKSQAAVSEDLVEPESEAAVNEDIMANITEETIDNEASLTNKRKRDAKEEVGEEPKRVQVDGAQAESSVEARVPEKRANASKKKNGVAWEGHEKPFIFLPRDDPEIVNMRKFFGLSSEFPEDNFVVRAEDNLWRTCQFVSSRVRDVVTASNSHRLKFDLEIVNTGIRLFTRQGAVGEAAQGCAFRLANEGLSTLSPFVSGSILVSASMADVQILLAHEYPKFPEFSEELSQKFKDMLHGSCIIKFDPSTEPGYEGSMHTVVLLPVWRAQVSVSLLINKAERRSLMHRITGKDLAIQVGLTDVVKVNEEVTEEAAAMEEDGQSDEADKAVVETD
ncbi:tRNA (cytosine(34)-C(5))-methyltransferase [Thoreauomyces humboldtii]|nr:tRNA (cytosine(34)-C(5))-methyltransferase [Thoreauomyces humboldtii]